MSAVRNLLLACGLFLASMANAQLGVVQAEYFWDTDPGAGNGTAMTASDGAFGVALCHKQSPLSRELAEGA